MGVRGYILYQAFILLGLAGCAPRCYIEPEEQVQFYPSYAYASPDRNAALMVARGRVVRPDAEHVLSDPTFKALNSLTLLLPDLGPALLNLQERLRPFAVEGRGDKAVPINLNGNRFRLPATTPNGYFESTVPVPPGQLPAGSAWIDFQTEGCKGRPQFSGRAMAIPETGLSIVSPLASLQAPPTRTRAAEDLLPVQQVSSYFMEPAPLPGMAARYASWAAEGAAFHYISPYPWQWTPQVESFLGNNGFPPGSLHLQKITLNEGADSLAGALAILARLFRPSAAHMSPALNELIQRFPKRRFVLIGDSSGPDAEIYAALARRYPQQVRAIFIRQIPGAEIKPWSELFKGLPRGSWKIFKSPNEMTL